MSISIRDAAVDDLPLIRQFIIELAKYEKLEHEITCSTFLARPGLYLEDLFVSPAFRGRGIGQALLRDLARRALEHGCGRMEWAVLDWNEPAIAFYRSIGAEHMQAWNLNRLTGEALRQLAR